MIGDSRCHRWRRLAEAAIGWGLAGLPNMGYSLKSCSAGKWIGRVVESSQQPQIIDLAVSRDVVDFCQHHRLVQEIQKALALATQWFGATNPRLTLHHDSEEDNESLSLTVDTQLSGEESLDAFDGYCESWVKAVPSDKAFLLSLDYNCVGDGHVNSARWEAARIEISKVPIVRTISN